MPLYSPTSSSQGLIKLLDAANGVKGTTTNCTVRTPAVVGATTITTSGAGTIVTGDVITFGLVNNVQDDPQGSATTQTIQQNRFGGNHALTRYKVTAGSVNVGDVGGGTASITITPGLEIAIPATTTIKVVTDVNLNASANANTHASTQLWVNRELFLYHTLQVTNAGGTPTVLLYESLDAVNWYPVTTTTPALSTASGIFVLPSRAYGYLKLLRDTATAGTVTAILLSQHATGNR